MVKIALDPADSIAAMLARACRDFADRPAFRCAWAMFYSVSVCLASTR